MRSSTSCAESRASAVALLAAVACLAAATRAGAAVELEVMPAWDGWSRPGRITETEVRVRSQERVSAAVNLVAGGETVQSRVDLEPGQWSSLAVPVRAAEAIVASVKVPGAGERVRDARLALSEAPLLAWISPEAAAAQVAGFHPLALDPAKLPRTASAYSSIDVLVIDRRSLPALGQDQFTSLLSYVAGCGRTVLVGASAEDVSLFRNAVGCGGRDFASVASGSEVGAALDQMLEAPVHRLPGALELNSVAGPDLRAWYIVVTLLVVCAACIVVVGIFTPSIVATAAVPLLATLGVLAFVQLRAPDARLTVWAETGSGERLAQYEGLQRATAMARGSLEVPVLSALARPRACRPGDRVTWSWDPEARRFSSAAFPGRLFSSGSVCYSGEFPVARSAAVRAVADGRIRLVNTGASTSPSALLTWNGRLFEVGALRAGEEVEIATTSGRRARGGAERKALERTPVDAPAILWPLELGRVTHAPSQSQAWLLLRVSSGEGG